MHQTAVGRAPIGIYIYSSNIQLILEITVSICKRIYSNRPSHGVWFGQGEPVRTHLAHQKVGVKKGRIVEEGIERRDVHTGEEVGS